MGNSTKVAPCIYVGEGLCCTAIFVSFLFQLMFVFVFSDDWWTRERKAFIGSPRSTATSKKVHCFVSNRAFTKVRFMSTPLINFYELCNAKCIHFWNWNKFDFKCFVIFILPWTWKQVNVLFFWFDLLIFKTPVRLIRNLEEKIASCKRRHPQKLTLILNNFPRNAWQNVIWAKYLYVFD